MKKKSEANWLLLALVSIRVSPEVANEDEAIEWSTRVDTGFQSELARK